METEELKKIEIEETKAKIESLEHELVKLKTLPNEAWIAFTIGINRMEESLKHRLIELNDILKSSNLKIPSKEENNG